MAPLKRGIWNMFNKTRRRNPEKFREKYDEMIAKVVKNPDKLKNLDEKIYATYIKKYAEYFRDKFVANQKARWDAKKSKLNEMIDKKKSQW
ncbi:hypothetical protein KKG31_07405 [Patescibacteria group bacterium]|nr:hypothetical protein [Patescibacteria group bacterium]